MHQPARQIFSRRHQERGVIEPGCPAGFIRGLRMRLEHQQSYAARAEHCCGSGPLHHVKAEHITVKIRDGIQLANPHRHAADPHRRAVGEGRSCAAGISFGARRCRGSRGERGSAGQMQQRASGEIEIHRGSGAWVEVG
jgi:hypothetical protein